LQPEESLRWADPVGGLQTDEGRAVGNHPPRSGIEMGGGLDGMV
jgi:hypothetical protein